MKLRHKASGEIWVVDHILATSEDGSVRNFFSGYELTPDDQKTPQQAPSVECELDRHDAILIEQARCIGKLHDNNKVITGRLDAIEEEYAKAKSWINTLISDNKRLKERLNAIEGNWR